MNKIILQNGLIISEGKQTIASIVIEDDKIVKISNEIDIRQYSGYEVFDATDKIVLPGIIDTHVHFREPGTLKKADINSESRAAAAGGVTTFFDMPNTTPQTITNELLEEKISLAEQTSLINYSFYLGATNSNLDELLSIDATKVPAIKLFYASSTGDMLVNDNKKVEEIFKQAYVPIAIHSEEQNIINKNYKKISNLYKNIPASYHEHIRSAASCYEATKTLVDFAKKHGSKIHLLHISTADELALFADTDLENKKITAEVTPNHLYFNSSMYSKLKMQIKCNPAIKSAHHQDGLLKALHSNVIDTIGSDHAPHLWTEKQKNYKKAPSGIPSIQHSLNIMLELVEKEYLTIEQLVTKMCHNPALIFNISKRGFIKENNFADITIVDLKQQTTVNKQNIRYKCKWSPLENKTFNSKVIATMVNGKFVYKNDEIIEANSAKRILFDR